MAANATTAAAAAATTATTRGSQNKHEAREGASVCWGNQRRTATWILRSVSGAPQNPSAAFFAVRCTIYSAA